MISTFTRDITRRPATFVATLACVATAATFAFAGTPPPCYLPDASGTVTLPDPNCPYLGPDEFHMVVDGLPAGTTIVITGIHRDFICGQPGGLPQTACNSPGGSLGGETELFDSTIEMHMQGTGTLGGFARVIQIPISCIAETGPRTPGDAVQDFDNEMVQLQGGIFGDPDFDVLAVRAGRDFGLPSPGHTTLTRQGPPGSNYNVDSFFDIFYEIDFQGAPGSALSGFAGTTQAVVHVVASGNGPVSTDPESWGQVKSKYR